MNFLWVGLSAVLVFASIPLPVAADDALHDDARVISFESDILSESGTQAVETETLEDGLPEHFEAEDYVPIMTLDQKITASEPVTMKVVAPLVITEVQMSGKCWLAKCLDETGKSKSNTAEYIELYNPNNEEVELSNYKLTYINSSGSRYNLMSLDSTKQNILGPHKFALITRDIEQPTYMDEKGNTVAVVPVSTFTQALADENGAIELSDAKSLAVIDQVAWGKMSIGFYGSPAKVPSSPVDRPLQRCFIDGVVQSFDPRDTSQEFAVYDSNSATPGHGLGCPAVAPEEPINECTGLRITEIAANMPDQFIELQNNTDRELSLKGCQLQTNRSLTKSYVFDGEILLPSEYRVVYVKDTPLTLTKTTSGIVYILSSDGLIEVNSQAYTNLASGTSWAQDEYGEWAQTYALTPGTINTIQKYLSCSDGYERNFDTGRCNKIATQNDPADCGEGRYRSEETGRCRNIPAASVLAACKLGQYRSEETNRCRNLVVASVPKPCKDNQYRSEETNRCRNLPVISVPDAAFAVRPVQDTAMAFAGWWALGGIGLLALSYAGWEWRAEIISMWIRLTAKLRLK